MTVEHPHFDDRSGDTRRQAQRRVAHVRSFFAEDGPQKLFFRRHRAFALRRNLADQNVARINLGTDIDNACLIEVFQSLFGDIRNIAGDFLRSKLGITRHHFKFFKVNGCEHVIAHDALGDQDRILEVVAIPGHERDQHVLAERQITQFGRWAISNDVALLDLLANLDQWPLVDAGILIGALEFHQTININA